MRKHRKNDILLIAALLVIAGAAMLAVRLTRTPGGTVRVSVDGNVVAELPLDRDCVRVFESERGSNTVVIEGGGVSVTAADCPDHVCVKQGVIRYDGESIVCLPHKLVVTVTGGQSGGLDAVSGQGVAG